MEGGGVVFLLGSCSAHSLPIKTGSCWLLIICPQAEGRLEEKLHEMYRWGKMHGWEPVVWVDGEPQPAAAVAAGTAAAAAASGTPVQY